jgi:hypothetical protein
MVISMPEKEKKVKHYFAFFDFLLCSQINELTEV